MVMRRGGGPFDLTEMAPGKKREPFGSLNSDAGFDRENKTPAAGRYLRQCERRIFEVYWFHHSGRVRLYGNCGASQEAIPTYISIMSDYLDDDHRQAQQAREAGQ